MRVSILCILLLILGLTYEEDNILLKVKVYVSENTKSASKLNDGNVKDNPMYFTNPTVKWAVFDFGDAYQISNITLWNGDNRGIVPIAFSIGDEFLPCKFSQQIKKYEVCQKDVIQNDKKIEINCKGLNPTGRYLALVKGNFYLENQLESLNILEVKAYGTLVKGHSYPTRPIINSKDIQPIQDDAFAITKTILNGVDTVTVPAYSISFTFINNNCQSIIWDPSTLSAFSVACQSKNGNGKIIVFGRYNFLINAIKYNEQKILTGNILKWLSPNSKNTNIKSTMDIKTVSDVRKKINANDIVYFFPWNAYSDDVINEILKMCLNGQISLILDQNFYEKISDDVIKSFMTILHAFNIEPVSLNYITWNKPKDFSLTPDLFTESKLNIEYLLENMAINSDYFIKQGNFIIKALSSLSISLIKKSNIGKTLNKIIKTYDPLMNWICPCQVAPAIDPTDRAIINIYSQLVMSPSLANSNYKLPCIDLFPGDFEKSPPTTSVTITVKATTDDTNHPIGLYLEAGATATYSIKRSKGTWTISVGCHTDKLDNRRPEWYRYPYMHVLMTLSEQTGTIYSPFGGTLWLKNKKLKDFITINLKNVVNTPLFNGRDKSASANWEQQSKNPGLWSQISGESMVFCVESHRVRKFSGDYLKNLMKNIWDKVVRMDQAITGLDWRIQKPQYTVLDIMTSLGNGHSGYPIVVWDDWFPGMFNSTLINSKGSWGMCHEIGHNMQVSGWTYIGLTEVTNNALCLFNYDKLWHIPRFGRDVENIKNKKNKFTKYLDKGTNFEDYRNDPWIQLALYSQMANNFGWGFFKEIFKYYISKNLKPSNDENKIKTWIITASTITKQNLLPLYDFWGVPFSKDIESNVNNLPCFFPNDFFTEFSPTRRDYIKKKYSNCSNTSSYYKDYNPEEDIKGNLPNFLTVS